MRDCRRLLLLDENSPPPAFGHKVARKNSDFYLKIGSDIVSNLAYRLGRLAWEKKNVTSKFEKSKREKKWHFGWSIGNVIRNVFSWHVTKYVPETVRRDRQLERMHWFIGELQKCADLSETRRILFLKWLSLTVLHSCLIRQVLIVFTEHNIWLKSNQHRQL